MNDRSAGAAPARLMAVLGPTNTGKTHLAVERMLGHASGMIGLPLRLLAREIYDRIVKARGAGCVALITGEEKIVPPRPQYFVCTVEAMPLNREVEFLAVDEIQLCADLERGHVFTHRLLHARGRAETMLLGAATIAPLIRRLCPDVEIQFRERFSQLTYSGSKKLTRLPPRSAIVAFSSEAVYAIAELIRRQRGGAAVVMGSLSPRTRNAQVALFQSGEVDFLVATDAIGMGLNMDVDHVAFAALRKFDGRRSRWLYAQEIGQIAGRAGRYRKDGTFGVTGECPDMDADLVAAVEGHVFPPVEAAEWRNARLDFQSLPALMRSLAESAPAPGLKLSEESQDETSLRQLANDETVLRRCRDRANLIRLWEVCQTPDFRKTSQEDHTRLIGTMFEHLTQKNRRLPEDWAQGQFAHLDRTDGDIDTLSARLARVRTLAYVANRGDWLVDPEGWQARTRALEDRLSDTLHAQLMQRFVDRRTSTLMRSLNQNGGPVLSGIGADGAVTVEGEFVGRLAGLHFEPARGASALENRALRGAVERSVAPEIARRLGRLAEEDDEAFALAPGGMLLWRGEPTGQLAGGAPFSPKVRLLGELGSVAARERAARRLEAFLADEAGRRLSVLKALNAASADGRLTGLARGLAYQLVEQFGVLDRKAAAEQLRALSQKERRALRNLGVRFGAFSIYLPDLLLPEARMVCAPFAELAHPGWRPSAGAVSALPQPAPPPEALGLRGLRAIGGLAAPVEALERLDALARAAPEGFGAFRLTPAILAELGWSPDQARRILRALGFGLAREEAGASESGLWRRRQRPAEAATPARRPRRRIRRRRAASLPA
ncbi:helicase-related protein [Methylocapsa sp. S129]|uniref:helicase-related protein n=1 Tax=Methylocapsa sp. S129 TaxID=1641869 RepID=UPI00131B91DA|nr:helicase-related protein [Methylocapsa sp. S129]